MAKNKKRKGTQARIQHQRMLNGHVVKKKQDKFNKLISDLQEKYYQQQAEAKAKESLEAIDTELVDELVQSV